MALTFVLASENDNSESREYKLQHSGKAGGAASPSTEQQSPLPTDITTTSSATSAATLLPKNV
jgi:hypothetical protein